jgi:hypothetical protein
MPIGLPQPVISATRAESGIGSSALDQSAATLPRQEYFILGGPM